MTEVTQSWPLVSQAFQIWKRLSDAKKAIAADDEEALRRLTALSEMPWPDTRGGVATRFRLPSTSELAQRFFSKPMSTGLETFVGGP